MAIEGYKGEIEDIFRNGYNQARKEELENLKRIEREIGYSNHLALMTELGERMEELKSEVAEDSNN